jgi:hypothetical protein
MSDKMKLSQVAKSVPFDNTGTSFVSTNVQDAIVEAPTLASGGGSGLIPEYTTDPVSPVAGQVWVKASTTTEGTPMGLLLAITKEITVVTGYQLSYKTTEGTIVRTTLA